jgi:hypothetical protein
MLALQKFGAFALAVVFMLSIGALFAAVVQYVTWWIY